MNLKSTTLKETQPVNKGYILILFTWISRKGKITITAPPQKKNPRATVIFGLKGLPTKGHELLGLMKI